MISALIQSTFKRQTLRLGMTFFPEIFSIVFEARDLLSAMNFYFLGFLAFESAKNALAVAVNQFIFPFST